MDKKISIIIIFAIMAGAGSFYGGMKFQQSRGSGFISSADFQNLRNLSPEDRQARMQQFGGANGLSAQAGGSRGQRANGGFAVGEVIFKDDSSITVKLQDGGSKIVFVSDSTAVMKSAAGSLGDIVVGEQITATGSPNADGSISAQSIQIRPTPLPAVKEFTVTGDNYSFLPAAMAVNKGDRVKITFKNVDGFHDLRIDEFNIATQKLQTGGEEAIEFTADKTGEFEYYCSIGNHRAMGMKGKLIVE